MKDDATDAKQNRAQECPYCGIRFSLDGVDANHAPLRFESVRRVIHGSPRSSPGDKEFTISCHRCPDCTGQIIWLNELGPRPDDPAKSWDVDIVRTTLLYPKSVRRRVPQGTPPDIAADFQEAWDVLSLSPKASAALARRCLQSVLRTQEQITLRTLLEEVQHLLTLKKLPQYLADDLDSIRVIGNFAAHPLKNTNTGEVVPVESHEAEWTLAVLAELIEFYFEREPTSRARRDLLAAKLKERRRS